MGTWEAILSCQGKGVGEGAATWGWRCLSCQRWKGGEVEGRAESMAKERGCEFSGKPGRVREKS